MLLATRWFRLRLRELAEQLQPASGSLKAAVCPTADSDRNGAASPEEQPPRKKQRKVAREFDFPAYRHRYVGLEIFYLGWNYHGFAEQAGTPTVEGELFAALRKTCLIAPDATWKSLQYSRCGRTDKGVSALGQVVALNLRSVAKLNQPAVNVEQELDYPTVINRALPADIRVLGWTPLPPDFSARFSATHREYKYFVVQHGQLDIAAMQRAADYMKGEHDFRHFCKIDAAHVTTFRRKILDFRIKAVKGEQCEDARLYALHIQGTAFLWHQVRCIAAVLLMIGQGLEEPELVQQLLDVERTPLKPQYNLAAEEPLLFYACGFKDLHFRRSAQSNAATAEVVSGMLQKHLVALGLLTNVAARLKAQAADVHGMVQAKPSKHVKLLKRAMEPPLEVRLQKYGKTLANMQGSHASLTEMDES
ncbi:hypothetical protein WJX72_008507 [[Myrmecia] bisecta]|uniref:tRNA pseudouridine synthase n=1 Tax=[Myrmecia] bisecta TaxID=41462 RepID=A0AAW1R969_9CHLO